MMKIGVIFFVFVLFGSIVYMYADTITAFFFPKLYHDTELADRVRCQSDWTTIDVAGRALVERDRQQIGLVFSTPFQIDSIGSGGLIADTGDPIDPRIRITDEESNIYEAVYSGARGKRIAVFRFEPLPKNAVISKLDLSCRNPLEFERVLWTTFSYRDMH